MIDSIKRDIGYAARVLLRTRLFAAGAIAVLGMGIGMATAVLSLAQAVLLRPLPVQDPSNLVVLWPTGLGGTERPITKQPLEHFRASSHTLRAIAGFGHWGAQDAAMSIDGQPQRVRQSQVTSNFFQVLGARPAIGRLLLPGDRADGGEHVTVISHATWRRLFHSDPNIVGRQITWASLGADHTIVGVAPAGLDYPIGTDVWTPGWDESPVDLVARLAPGASIAAARAEFATFVVEEGKRVGDPSVLGGFTQPLAEAVNGQTRPAVVAMSMAAGLLLLIACTNVGNLLLLRGGARLREVSIRRALGATRAALIRQTLAESALLAVGGGLLGVVVAWMLLKVFVALAPRDFPRIDVVSPDSRVILAAFLITVIAVVVTSLVPALSGSRQELEAPILRLGHRGGTASRRRRQAGRALVVGQVALSFVILAGSGLVVRSLVRLETLDLGYGTEQLSMVSVLPPTAQYDTAYAQWLGLARRSLAAMREVRGVVAVGPAVAPPFTGSNTFTAAIEAEAVGTAAGPVTPIVGWEAVDGDYFTAMGLPLIRGRVFTDADRPGSPPVAVVTRTIAGRLWPGQDPVGRRVRFAGDTSTSAQTWRTVVGVVSDFHYRDYRTPTPTAFFEYRQLPFWQGLFVVRTRGDPAAAAREIRTALARATPEMPVWEVTRMAETLAEPLARPRFDAALLSSFAIAAVLVSAIGLYVLTSTLV